MHAFTHTHARARACAGIAVGKWLRSVERPARAPRPAPTTRMPLVWVARGLCCGRGGRAAAPPGPPTRPQWDGTRGSGGAMPLPAMRRTIASGPVCASRQFACTRFVCTVDVTTRSGFMFNASESDDVLHFETAIVPE